LGRAEDWLGPHVEKRRERCYRERHRTPILLDTKDLDCEGLVLPRVLLVPPPIIVIVIPIVIIIVIDDVFVSGMPRNSLEDEVMILGRS
jgi:hypothetical protein